jgi:hypothetical protein
MLMLALWHSAPPGDYPRETEPSAYLQFPSRTACPKNALGPGSELREAGDCVRGLFVDDFAARISASWSRLGASSKRSLSVLAIALVAFSLAACASRPESGFLSAVALSSPDAVDHTLLVATTRQRDERPGTLFNGERASAVDYAEITVSVPPTHRQGAIEWATTPPGDPNADFVVRKEDYLGGDRAFVHAVNAQLALRPPGKRSVVLFVHGFNTMFAEGLYRLAQLVHDSKAPGVPVLFT